MNAIETPRGIAGLAGREPIGAAVTIGVKDKAKGFPTEKDRFHIVVPREENHRRPHHPSFAFFNKADEHKRKMIRGALVHATIDEVFEYGLRNQNGPHGAHPNRLPFCVGNGDKARRWTGTKTEPDKFEPIECPHDKCEYRSPPAPNKPTPCKPFMRLVFQLQWPEETQAALLSANKPPAPTMLVKFQSGSWNTTRNLLGFFEHIERAATGLGLNDWSLFGVQFVLTLSEQTKPSGNAKFPVVSMTPTIEPAQFFMRQREDIRAMAAPVPHAHEALTDDSQQDPAIVADDYAVLTVPTGK